MLKLSHEEDERLGGVLMEWWDGDGAARVLARHDTALLLERAMGFASLADMELLMKDIPLEKVTTSMTINATGAILLAFYVALAKKQGADLSKIGGTTQKPVSPPAGPRIDTGPRNDNVSPVVKSPDVGATQPGSGGGESE